MNPLPIQPAKIHCPLARDDTLTRERLNSWVEQAVAGRLALIVAEAGFGKTTLLADWARHTRRMTAWYRLESDDRDWLTFIRHVVAGGRELDPEFAPDTFGLLMALESGGATQQELIVSLAREVAAFGTGSVRGFTLILDDYHVIDGFAETEPIVRALLDRTGPGFSVVISTRTAPRLSLGRVRARGGVMTLEGSDLCFDVDETTRLFRDAYHRPLDEDIVSDLWDRTEGWAALLTLVRTGLEDEGHQDARDLVAHLDASHGDLYEFLADEVLASLSPELQSFLKRVALLTGVDVASAVLASDLDVAHVTAAIADCERLGLLTRPDRESPHRFHPLVREFLVARLTSEIGPEAVRDIHLGIAQRGSALDWHLSAFHFLAAGDVDGCQATVDSAIEYIVGNGDFERTRPFLEEIAGSPDRATALMLRSKLELTRGDFRRAVDWARAAVDRAQGGPLDGMARLNLASTLAVTGFADEAAAMNAAAIEAGLSEDQRHVAMAGVALREASDEGDLVEIADELRRLAARQERAGMTRYAGISHLNLATILIWLGEAPQALREATEAETALGGRSRVSLERAGATATRAVALAQLGRVDDAIAMLESAWSGPATLASVELSIEAAGIHADFGAVEDAEAFLRRVDPSHGSRGHTAILNLTAGQVALRRGEFARARLLAEELQADPCSDAAGKLRGLLLQARTAIASGDRDAATVARDALRVARVQRSRPGTHLADILARIASGGSLDEAIAQADPRSTYCWSILAEELCGRLDHLSDESRDRVLVEATLRPRRWRDPLRQMVTSTAPSSGHAATLLAQLGTEEDAAFLRTTGSTRKSVRPAALAITQRLAKRVYLADLGVVEVLLGGTPLPRNLRRKVLALLCFLTSRPSMAANREEALDALWPDLTPEAGGNSLHQAIYFMRRVFEPDFREGMSAGYVQVDGEIVALNPALIDSASRECWRLLQSPSPDLGTADRLLGLYSGRYALDFAYEEWASGYRENLHAAVLATTEAAVARARRDRDFDHAIRLGLGLLAVDPQADGLELELLRTYKASGRQAAAAEQYAHYAAFVRNELAADPVPFDEI
jgi:DNA-binding SARP family transcriptional activator